MIDIIGKRKWFYAFSGILLCIGLISLFRYELRLSIDFQGGSLLELQTAEPINSEEVRKIVEDLGYKDNIIQVAGEKGVIIRTKSLYPDVGQRL